MAIQIQDLTDAQLKDGDGVFDVLMRSVSSHLDQEYSKNRIRGPEYSQVYLGAINAVLEKSLSFVLQSEKIEADIALVTQKRINSITEELLIQEQVSVVQAELLNIPKQGALIDAQASKVVVEEGLVTAQVSKLGKDEDLVDSQIVMATAEVLNVPKAGAMLDAQKDKVVIEATLVAAQELKVDADTVLSTAQAAKVTLETTDVIPVEVAKLTAEKNIAVQGVQNAVAEVAIQEAQVTKIEFEVEEMLPKQLEKMTGEASILTKEAEILQDRITNNLANESLTIGYQKDIAQKEILLSASKVAKLDADKLMVDGQSLKISQETSLVAQRILNAIAEEAVSESTACKLKAEFDTLMQQELRIMAETALLGQKKATEQAQTLGTNISPSSVLGKQNALYVAQTNGYARDAEQKAAKIMVDTWNTRRVTDETTPADANNHLDNVSIGQVILQLKAGIDV